MYIVYKLPGRWGPAAQTDSDGSVRVVGVRALVFSSSFSDFSWWKNVWPWTRICLRAWNIIIGWRTFHDKGTRFESNVQLKKKLDYGIVCVVLTHQRKTNCPEGRECVGTLAFGVWEWGWLRLLRPCSQCEEERLASPCGIWVGRRWLWPQPVVEVIQSSFQD